MRKTAAVVLALGVLALTPQFAAPARGGEFTRTVPFAVDQWIDIGLDDGAVKIYRIRVARQTTGLKNFKSVVARPTNAEFMQDVQIQIEFSNSASRDWQVKANIAWLDGSDRVIDGYKGSESLDEESKHDLVTMLFPTLKYGLEVARKLRIELEVEPD
jgi:hypothetical protein